MVSFRVSAPTPTPGQFNFGIVVGGGNTGLQVLSNTVEGGGTGILFSPAIFLARFPASTEVEVRTNKVSGMQSDGIRAAGNAVHCSLRRKPDDRQRPRRHQPGSNNTNNRFERNHSLRHVRDGIRVGPTGTTGNVFDTNQMADNGEHDAHDDTRAANVWVNNHCETDFPVGSICGVK
jgi:hypothetical protein